MRQAEVKRRRESGRVFFPRVTPMSAVRRFVRQIVRRFRPEKVILFGSYAYGRPTPDSDVDLLVVMPTRNEIEEAVRIDEAITQRGFPLDLLVRTPKTIADQLRAGDCLLQEIMARGKVLYEKVHAPVGAQGRKRPGRGSAPLHTQALAQR